MLLQNEPKFMYHVEPDCTRFASMALYALLDDDVTPVLPWSVHDPASSVDEVAYPMAELCDPNVDTL